MGTRLSRAVGTVFWTTLVGRVLGFLRELLIAQVFGMSAVTDSYVVATTLPTVLMAVVPGAFNAAAVPLLTRLRGDRAGTRRLFGLLLGWSLPAALLAAVVGVAAAPAILHLLAPAFPAATDRIAVPMFRIVTPVLVWVAFLGVAGSVLNAQGHFLAPSIGPGLASLGVIGAVVFLHGPLGFWCIPLGVAAGYTLQGLAVLAALLFRGVAPALSFSTRDPALRQVGRLLWPMAAGASVGQLGLFVDRIFASGLPPGSVSALNYAGRVLELPLGLFVGAVTVPLLPRLSELAGDVPALRREVERFGVYLAAVLLPLSVFLLLAGGPVVAVLFQRGAFLAHDTRVTAFALTFFALGLLPMALRDLFARAFYALGDTATPAWVGAAGVGVNILLDFLLIHPLAQGGLALGTAGAAWAGSLVLAGLLYRRVSLGAGGGFGVSLWRLALATGVCAGVVWAVRPEILGLPGGLWGWAAQVGLFLLAALGSFFAAAWLLGVGEARSAVRRLGRGGRA